MKELKLTKRDKKMLGILTSKGVKAFEQAYTKQFIKNLTNMEVELDELQVMRKEVGEWAQDLEELNIPEAYISKPRVSTMMDTKKKIKKTQLKDRKFIAKELGVNEEEVDLFAQSPMVMKAALGKSAKYIDKEDQTKLGLNKKARRSQKKGK